MPASTPRDNAGLAALLSELAQLMELTGVDRFKVIAVDRAARLADSTHDDLVTIAKSDNGRKRLMEIDGIGAKIADKIIEYTETGKVQEHQDLLAKVPPGLLQVLAIPGLGPKTVKAIWETTGITDVAGLRKIIADGSIMSVPRMGEKTVRNIAEAIEFSEKASERIPLGIALPIAEAIVSRLAEVKGIDSVAYAGSLRRGKETIGDVDILVCASKPEAAHKAFTSMPGVEKVLASGESKSSVRVKFNGTHLQADLRVVPKASAGAALLYFTGSKEHNVRLRELALKNGLTLNEYGLYPEDDDPTPPQHRKVKAKAGATEPEIYQALGLSWVPPERREDEPLDELEKSVERGDLITLDDIKAELHAHTTASDGALSIVELATQAKARGFHTIAVTDHSQSSAIAGGLKPDALKKHIEAVHEARSEVKGITILAGSEVDILADGDLDYDDDLLAMLDIVVASPHASLRQEPKVATKRLLKAIEHPLVHIIGHPTGRLINRREGFAPDMKALIAAAVEHNTALEINANWMRLDLRDTHVRLAVETWAGATKSRPGCLVTIDCDVHAAVDFDQLRFGVLTARRGGLRPDMCPNTWTAKRLHDWLKSKRP